MVGRTKEGDPVWKHAGGKPFLILNKTEVHYLAWGWDWCWWTYRRLPAPHLSYGQVATANEKGRTLLQALRNGPVILRKGFIYSRSNRLLLTKATAEVVLHWMTGNGFVFTYEPMENGSVRIDLDAAATRANGVT
jgi:hypothetical protein